MKRAGAVRKAGPAVSREVAVRLPTEFCDPPPLRLGSASHRKRGGNGLSHNLLTESSGRTFFFRPHSGNLNFFNRRLFPITSTLDKPMAPAAITGLRSHPHGCNTPAAKGINTIL
jgi:hypothetical protein